MAAADLLGNFVGPFLIWVWQCSEDLRRIINETLCLGQSTTGSVIGTEKGTGKSLFGDSIFWVMQVAPQRGKVVWYIK